MPAKVVSDKSLECITPALEHGEYFATRNRKRDLWTNSVEVAIDGRVSLVSLLLKGVRLVVLLTLLLRARIFPTLTWQDVNLVLIQLSPPCG